MTAPVTSFAPRRVPAVIEAGAPPGALPGAIPEAEAAARKSASVAVPALYLVAALALTWRLWADPAARLAAGNPHDGDLFAWFMQYAASAVRHGRLPALVTTALNAPAGVSLMWNTPVLLAGVVLAPVTWLLGPQTSLTILTTAGFAGSATALYWVLRRRAVSVGAAALAGAVYGFSPALLQTSMSHFALQLAILPPLIVDAGLRLAAGQPGGGIRAGIRTGAWLGVLLAGQLFLGEELALSTAITGVLLAAVLAISRPRAALSRIRPASAGLVTSAVVTAGLAGPALLTQFRGPLSQHGALFPADFFVNDITSFVTPQSSLLFHTAASAAQAAHYQGAAPEYLGYLGWPLIAALVPAAVIGWRRPAARAAAVTTAILCLLSLGGHPLISGHSVSGVYLPWHWIEAMPVMASALPARLSILADGTAAVLLALGVDEARAHLALGRAASRQASGAAAPAATAPAAMAPAGRAPAGRAPGGRGQALVLGVAVLCCLPLIPRPLAAVSTPPVPAGWSGVLARLHVQAGTAVLAVPLSSNVLTLSMRWSAETGGPASMIGGYFLGPGAGGKPAIDGPGPGPAAMALNRLWAAGLPPRSPYRGPAIAAGLLATGPSGRVQPLPAPLGQSLGQVLAAFTSWRPGAVIADATADSPLGRFLVRLLGAPSAQDGGVTGWRLHSGPGTGQ